MNETVTVYVTKYALTSGIIKCKGVIHNSRFFAWSPKRLSSLDFSLSEFVLTESKAQKVLKEKRLIAINRLSLLIEKNLKRLRAMQVRKQYDNLPTEAKQYVNALVLEVKQNPKLDYLELFYKVAIKDNIIDCLFADNYNWNQSIARKITFWLWLFLAFCKTDVFIPKQLKKDANLFMLSIAIASNFVVEGDYKEIYGTYHMWGSYSPSTTEE